jgi:prepilin-type N-terminal cleavage/methylation domain-containing protein
MRHFLSTLRRNTDFPAIKPSRHSGQKRYPGFTFIELLIVTSIIGIVMVAIYSSFISGMQLWQRSKNLNQAGFRVILGLEKFSANLRQSLAFPQIGFSGTGQEISFPFLDGRDIVKISFKFDPEGKSLQRSQEKYGGILTGKELSAKVFIAGIEEADLSYYYFDNVSQKYLWQEEWKSSDGIPLAVRLNIKYNDGVKGATVFIPVSR